MSTVLKENSFPYSLMVKLCEVYVEHIARETLTLNQKTKSEKDPKHISSMGKRDQEKNNKTTTTTTTTTKPTKNPKRNKGMGKERR